MKKFLAVVLSLFLIISVCPMSLFRLTVSAATSNTTEFAGGSGTKSDPYLVATPDHLNNVRYYLDSNFKLIDDIEFTEIDFEETGDFYNDGNGWLSIGNNTNKFVGVFDGDGHMIKGILSLKSSNSYSGLFGNNAGTIKNLHVSGSITNETWGSYVGGVAAYNSGTIFRCSNEIFITLNTLYDTVYAGGITGYNDGVIKECYNAADVFASERLDEDRYVGGISGYGTSISVIENCYNSGNVTSKAGYFAFGTLTYGHAYAGGIKGYGPDAKNCYNIGTVIAYAYSSNEEHMYETTYPSSLKGFDFENIWTMGGDPNYSYPELKCFTLNGNLDIKGDVAYLSTVEPRLSEINRIDDSFTYEWLINGDVVGADQKYTIQSDDIGKKLQCKLTGTKKYNMGTLYSEEFVVIKAKQLQVPINPVIEERTNTSLILRRIDGYEYSKDGLNWQKSNTFIALLPNEEYTLCQRIAETDTHYASVPSEYTCGVTLKNSVLAPDAPTVEQATEKSVTLTVIDGYEYSMDGFTWQSSNTFNGLNLFETYTFYQRIAETSTDYASASSTGISFKVKNVANVPVAPTLTEKTNNKIAVEIKDGFEYSIDKTTWNTTGVFSDLQPNQMYSVYCRTQETDTHYASDASNALRITTLKNNADTPPEPKAETISSNSIILVAISGGEYSKDGTTWQTSNVFNGLSPNKSYTFYQRIAETNENYVSQVSSSATFRTLKQTLSTPDAPTLLSKTANSVTLTSKSGYEYSKDGTTWQSSSVFLDLLPNTTYIFYQRIAETDTNYATEKSASLSVTTLKKDVSTPSKPIASKITQTSVTLLPHTGYEYSKDGSIWQSSNIFTGLSINTNYYFYQRIAETNTSYASDKSEALLVTTLPKGDCINKADKPILVNASNNSISLLKVDGYEYKIDDGSWQTSPVFNNLRWRESYTLYQRIKETATHKASAISEGLVVNLDMNPSVAFCQSMLSDYIDIYGTTLSNGNKRVTKLVSSTYIYLEKTPNGIYCSTYSSTSSSNTSMKYYFGFTLTPNSKYIDPTLLIEGYYGKNLISTLTIEASVDRTTYTNSSNIHLDDYQDGSNGHQLFNTNLKLLCTSMHVFLLDEVGCGIGGIGFLDFSGENDRGFYCDAALNHQLGNKVLKYGYNASCERSGYTGDYCCSYCGEIIEKGRAIQSLGGHKYNNTCDTECNDCGFKRDIEHTYSNNCDTICNVCSAKREVNHLYDNDCDSKCNECDCERKTPHIYDDSNDLICNGCGYERPPYIIGDVDDNDEVTDADAEWLLMFTFFPEDYPVNQICDFNGDGKVNDADAEHLLMFTFFPEDYPLH